MYLLLPCIMNHNTPLQQDFCFSPFLLLHTRSIAPNYDRLFCSASYHCTFKIMQGDGGRLHYACYHSINATMSAPFEKAGQTHQQHFADRGVGNFRFPLGKRATHSAVGTQVRQQDEIKTTTTTTTTHQLPHEVEEDGPNKYGPCGTYANSPLT